MSNSLCLVVAGVVVQDNTDPIKLFQLFSIAALYIACMYPDKVQLP